jgi:hypothetical protein
VSTVDEIQVDKPTREPVFIDLAGPLDAEAVDKNRRVHSAHVYVIEADGLGLFKIGLSIEFKTRFPTYRTECPVHCWPLFVASVPASDVYEIEKALHERYASRRTKGEWFALTSDDVDGLETAIREAANRHVRAIQRELKQISSIYYTASAKRSRDYEIWLSRVQACNAIPTHEYVLDRLQNAQELGEAIRMIDLVRSIDRKPQAIHAAVRWLLEAGEVAIVHPLRHPNYGYFQFDEYRRCDLILPDATCDWEETTYGTEVLVSEPLGQFVPEFFGRSRKPEKEKPRRKQKFRDNTDEIAWTTTT